MEFTLENIIVPVSDPDRAKAFYVDQVGFHLDVDRAFGETFRVIQMTPPGSHCSIVVGVGLGDSPPGSVHGLHLVVSDIEAARALLVERGVEAGEHWHIGAAGRQDGPDPEHGDYTSYFNFADPDGNSWIVQERRSPAPPPPPG